jgi:hypothetical protein
MKNVYIIEKILIYCDDDSLITLLYIIPKLVKKEIGDRISKSIAWKYQLEHIDSIKQYQYSSSSQKFHFWYCYGWDRKTMDPNAFAMQTFLINKSVKFLYIYSFAFNITPSDFSGSMTRVLCDDDCCSYTYHSFQQGGLITGHHKYYLDNDDNCMDHNEYHYDAINNNNIITQIINHNIDWINIPSSFRDKIKYNEYVRSYRNFNT